MNDPDQREDTGLALPTAAEEKLIAAARLGTTCDLSGASDADRTIRAEVIRILCIAARPDWPSGEKGVALENAIVTGELDFRSAALVVPLKLVNCQFDADIDLSEAQARTTTISSSSIGAFVSDGAHFAGNLVLDSITASRGISLMRTVVAGYLNCSGSTLQPGNGHALNADSLDVSGGAFFRDGFAAEGEVNLLGAKIGKTLDFSGARLENADGNALNADSLDVKGAAFFRAGFTARGEVNLLGAKIGQSLDFSGSRLENAGGNALSADSLDVTGGAYFRDGFAAEGEVNLLGAKVGKTLDFSAARLENADGYALNADSLEVGGAAFFRDGFSAKGEVNLFGARVGQSLEISGGRLENPQGYALNAAALGVAGAAQFFTGTDRNGHVVPFSTSGEVNLQSAKIGLTLSFAGARLENADGYALNADSLQVGGGAFFREGFAAYGEVNLLGASVGKSLDFSRASLENADGKALNADSLEVGGAAFFREGFTAKGELNLFGAKVGQSLDFSGAHLENAGGYALNAEAVEVKKAINFRRWQGPDEVSEGFSAVGVVRLLGATVGQAVAFDGATVKFREDAQLDDVESSISLLPVLDLEGARIDGTLQLTAFPEAPVGDVDLTRARAARFSDDPSSWPRAPHCLRLDGFVYDAFDEGTATDLETRLSWLGRDRPPTIAASGPRTGPTEGVRTQPYEQLANVYDRMGDEKRARQTRIAKQRALRKSGVLPRRELVWSWLLDRTMLYGYAAWRSLFLGIVMILIGWVIFSAADADGVMRATKPAEAPEFQPLVYSIDSFVPIIDFRQEREWSPSPDKTWELLGAEMGGVWVQRYLWLHIALGWLVTTLAVAALTGLVRRT